jgi:uncharacterized protein YggE
MTSGSTWSRWAPLLAAVYLAAAAPGAAQESGARISVTGAGEASAAPDIARMIVGATVEGAAASEVAAEAASRMRAVIAALREAGAAEADLRTVSIDLSPVYAHERGAAPELTGWRAAHRLSATLRNLDALGPAIDAAVAAGATDVQGVTLDLADRSRLLREARRAAVADARAAAQLLADASGVRLGALKSLSLDGGGGGPMPMRAVAMDAESTPVAAGVLTVRAVVSAVFAAAE